jgi:hypothetical protein
VKKLSVVLLLVLASGPLVSGHHSFPAFYFEDQSVTLQGTLVEFAYSAPHAWVHFSVADEGGPARKYSAEWSNPNRLSRDGITKDTFKAGDYLIISGSPGRNPSENRIHLKRIERPADGFKWVSSRR